MLDSICKEYTHAMKRTTTHCVQRLTEREIHKTRLHGYRDRKTMSHVKTINEEKGRSGTTRTRTRGPRDEQSC